MSAKQFAVVHGRLTFAVADAGTFTTSPPAGTNIGTFIGGIDHRIVVGQKEYSAPDKFGLALTSATVITVTNRSGATWAADSEFWLQIEAPGQVFVDSARGTQPNRTTTLKLVEVNLGAPIAASSTNIIGSASWAAAATAAFQTAQIAAGTIAGLLDVPRALVAAWTGTAVLTVTGTDEYGAAVVESSASGTSLTGKKAFKTVTGISTSADITVLSVGTSDVLGLPLFVPIAGATGANIIKEQISATAGAALAAATAGTLVSGLTNTTGGSTATTADVRGTYDPNAVCDGAASFVLILAMADPGYLGTAQYAG